MPCFCYAPVTVVKGHFVLPLLSVHPSVHHAVKKFVLSTLPTVFKQST